MGVHVEFDIVTEVFVRDEAAIRGRMLAMAEAEVERHNFRRGWGRAWFSRRPSPEPGIVRLQVTVPVV